MSSLKSQSCGVKCKNVIYSKMSKKKGLGLADQNPLHALLPGAKIDTKRGGKISVNVGFSREIVVFNVGGTRFETYRSTLYSQPKSPLTDEKFLKSHYIEDRKEYFFDRDPDIFKAILSYLRTGELHIPSNICGPAAREELQYWGVADDVIQRCCWSHYNSWNSTLEALTQLERDRKGSISEQTRINTNTRWGRLQPRVWAILNKPNSSLTAKLYGYLSLFFVLVSITSFVTETLPMFQYQIKHSLDSGNERPPRVNETNKNSSVMNTTNDPKVEEVVFLKSSHPVFFIIDVTCLAFFTIEYAIRIIFATNKLRFIRSMMGVVDVLAIVPDYIQFIVYAVHPEMLYDGDLDYIAVLRVARVLRIFRLIRHVPGLWILIYTLKSSLKELLLVIVFLVVGMLIFSSLIYFVDDRSTFKSIPHSFWWALITMTTVGYGDMYPVTELGYLVGSFTALSGLLMIGFSVPILVNNFIMFYKHLEFAMNDEPNKEETSVKGENKQFSTNEGSCSNNNSSVHNENSKEVKIECESYVTTKQNTKD